MISMFQHSILFVLLIMAMTCKAQEKAPLPPDLRQLPDLAWKYSLKAPVYASPVISESTVYFGGLDSVFYALDLVTGKVKWTFRTRGEIRSTCAVRDQMVCFASGDGKLYCLDKSGKLLWSFKIQSDKKEDFADYFQSSPVFHKNTFYFGSGDGFVYAVNASDGSLKWKYLTGGVVHARPAIGNGNLYIGSFDGFVYAFALADGKLKWKFKTVGHRFFPRGEVQGNPVFFSGLVLVGTRDYNVYAIDAENGYCHWNKAFLKGWVLSATLHDSLLYLAGADERMISAVDPVTGQTIMKKDMEFLQFGNPAFSQNMMYAGLTNGKVYGLDKKTGDKVWTFTTEGYQKNRMKYFKEDDSYRDDIYNIITSNEQFVEVEQELGGIFSSPAITMGYLVFTSTEGSVYCLKSKE